jgi:hypothetical protein
VSYLASPGDWVRVTEVYDKRLGKVQPGFVGKVRGISSQERDPSWWPAIVFESGQIGNFHVERWEPRFGDLCEWTYDEKTVRGTIKRLEDGDIWVVLSNGQCGPLSNAARATLRPAAGSVDAAHRETAGAEPSGKAPQDSARPDPYVLHEAKLAARLRAPSAKLSRIGIKPRPSRTSHATSKGSAKLARPGTGSHPRTSRSASKASPERTHHEHIHHRQL